MPRQAGSCSSCQTLYGMKTTDATRSALNILWAHNKVRVGDRDISIVILIPENESRPFSAAWWRGKEACIIGADEDGNFLLRHCDGSVRYWEHAKQSDTVLAKSVCEFVAMIK